MSGPDAAAAWLLTAAERGNLATTIDAARAGGRAWTVGNLVRVHVDGAAYFARLYELLSGLGPGDWVYLADHLLAWCAGDIQVAQVMGRYCHSDPPTGVCRWPHLSDLGRARSSLASAPGWPRASVSA